MDVWTALAFTAAFQMHFRAEYVSNVRKRCVYVCDYVLMEMLLGNPRPMPCAVAAAAAAQGPAAVMATAPAMSLAAVARMCGAEGAGKAI